MVSYKDTVKKIAGEHGLPQERFYNFMAGRFGTPQELHYVKEWAGRIAYYDQQQLRSVSDDETWEALKATGFVN